MAAKAIFKANRSFRTLRTGGATKRFDFKPIRSIKTIQGLNDLRSFFYEYSLFVGDIQSLPGMPNLNIAGDLRNRMLKAGRIMGDAKAISGTVRNLMDGVHASDFEGAGERYYRRFGGRVTGKVLMSIPGSNIFSRGARSVVGANMQKEFDKSTKKFFRRNESSPAMVGKTFGNFDFRNLTHNQKVKKVVEMVTEDVQRQAYNLTPVKTGKLRGSLRAEMGELKSRGGSTPTGKVSIGGEGIDYALKIEYGEGKGFNIGAAYTSRYFPHIPTEAQSLRSNKTNRRAVNKATGKGAMMRRGATLAIQRLGQSGLGRVVTDTKSNLNYDEVVKRAKNVGNIGI